MANESTTKKMRTLLGLTTSVLLNGGRGNLQSREQSSAGPMCAILSVRSTGGIGQ
jgi:hypothetical protein